MQIILWRHADAEDLAASDLARNLTPKGLRQADRMASWLNGQIGDDWHQWRVVASPANRAQQTARALQRPVETVHAIAPDAPPEAVLTAAGWNLPAGGAAPNVIVVGHQPTLGMVAALIIHGEAGYLSVKKGAMWWFEVRERDGKRQALLKAVMSPEAV